MKKLRLVVQTEAALIRIKTRQSFRSLALLAIATVFTLMALQVLNKSAFEALETSVGALLAGLIIGSVDLSIAALLLRAALAEDSEGQEEKLAQQLRKVSYASLNEDIEEMRAELHSFAEDVGKIRRTVSQVTSGISGSIGLILNFVEALSRTQKTSEKGPLSEDPAQGRDPSPTEQ